MQCASHKVLYTNVMLHAIYRQKLPHLRTSISLALFHVRMKSSMGLTGHKKLKASVHGSQAALDHCAQLSRCRDIVHGLMNVTSWCNDFTHALTLTNAISDQSSDDFALFEI